MKITVAIIAKSEKVSKQILESVGFAEEVVIVVDAPAKTSKTVGKTHFHYRPLADDFAAQRNFAIKNAHHDWILFVDDDEYVGTELAREIKLLDEKVKYSGFFIRRLDVCFHQPLLHGETGHTKLLRLAKKTAGTFIRPVHEIWQVSGEVGELLSPLYHIKNGFIGGFLGRMIHYADIDAVILTKEGKPFTFWRLFFNPKAKFLQNYFFRAGFFDGTVGLFSAYLMSIQSLTVRVYQWAKRN
jgi:glycosyltransferase involved in cell wall biosynthesis